MIQGFTEFLILQRVDARVNWYLHTTMRATIAR